MTEPWWISLIKAAVIVNVVLVLFAYLTLIERKVMGRMQLRYGPNRAGPFGLLQPIADLVPLVRKEAFSPSSAIELPYNMAPIISAFTAIAAFAVIPWTAYSFAIDLAMHMIPAFEAAYAATDLAPPDLPAEEPMATIRP